MFQNFARPTAFAEVKEFSQKSQRKIQAKDKTFEFSLKLIELFFK